MKIYSLGKQMVFGHGDQPSKASCTCGQLRQHIEAQFKPGMSWENYGDWVLDHITPQAFFETGEEEFMNHFSNLQPLWNRENHRKSDRMGNTSARILVSTRRPSVFTPEIYRFPPPPPLTAKPNILVDVLVCGKFENPLLDVLVCGRFLEEAA